MTLGYVFFWALMASIALVGLNRIIEDSSFECNHCGRTRFRQSHCSRCGVIGNPTPEPPKKNLRSKRVRFE